MERLMSNRILQFLNKYDILCDEQYGFRPKHSTEHALIDAIDKLYSSLDDNKTCIGVFMDLSMAFDTVDHTVLLNKMHQYDIRGTIHNWINGYLSDRYLFTSVKNTYSHPGKIQCGVPQGSILGPLLFIIYVDDICRVSNKARIVFFADDTNIFFESDVNDSNFHAVVLYS